VLEGELPVQVRDELRAGRAGEFFLAPAGTPHTLANRGERDARLLVTCTPAGFERSFDRLAQGIGGDPPEDAIAAGPPIGGPAQNRVRQAARARAGGPCRNSGLTERPP
jgi:Cupin domain